MDRRDFMKAGLQGATAVAAAQLAQVPTPAFAQPAPTVESSQRPNVLYFICHDLGTALSCYNWPDVKSPNLDAFATEGVRFTNYYCGSTPCSPSRGCIVTGRYAHSNGLIGLANKGWSLPETEKTVVDYFNDAGYYTANLGGQHERTGPNAYAYKETKLGPRTADRIADEVCDFLKRYDRSEGPFYLNAYTQEVHAPWDRPEFQGRYSPAEVTPLPFQGDIPFVRNSLAAFYGSVSFMDEQFGRILACLRETGLDQNTWVIFTTDHGVGFPRAKSTLYDPGLLTALIMRWPGRFKPGTTCDHLLSNVDLLPTQLEALGFPASAAIQGRSFAPAILGGDYTPREAIFAERNYHDDYDPIRCVRTRQYKYIRNYGLRARPKLPEEETAEDTGLTLWNSGRPRPREELYDLARDPREFNNLAEDPDSAEVLTQMRERLDAWMRDTNDYMRGAREFVDYPSEDRRTLPLPLGASPKPQPRKPPQPKAKP